MKAIRIHEFGGPEVLRLEEAPDPKPSGGQVLIRVRAVGVNPVETYIRAGIYGKREFPFTPGSDAAGVVEAVGPGVTQFRVGDRVYTSGAISGAYAELALCNESQVHPLPEHVSFQQGASLGVPAATAYRAMFIRGRAKPGETVLIHGATGGVGISAVQLAVAAGLTVIGTGGTDEGRRLVTDQGAQHVLNHRDPGYLQQILSLTNNRGVNLVLEMLANVNLGKDLTILAKAGRVVVIGSRGTVEIDPRDMMSRDSDIRGMSLMHASEEELHSIHSALVAALQSRTLRPIVGKELPLSQAPQAHQQIMEEHHYGKIVLIP